MKDLRQLEIVGTEFGTVTRHADSAVISAGPGTDAFSPPDGTAGKDRLPGLRIPVPPGTWRVQALVQPEFQTMFDAAALMLRCAYGSWAKLAYEQSPDGRAMAVSVVTRGVSDDANGPAFSVPALWLRALFTGSAIAFHTSVDGTRWDLLRLFALPSPILSVDLIAQSPTGPGCTARIEQVSLSTDVPADLRDGS